MILIATSPAEVYAIGTTTGIDSSMAVHPAKLKLNLDNQSGIENNGVDVRSDFGAKGDGITDDTEAIQKAINYCLTNSRKLYFPKGSYLVGSKISTYEYFVGIFSTLTNIDGFSILGNDANIIDGRNMTKLGVHFSPVFLFDSCKNISIQGLNYRCEDTSYDKEKQLGYWGATYVMFLNDCSDVKVDFSVYNARYGIRTGDFNNPKYNGLNGIVNLDAKIVANTTGYPVSIEMGSHINIDLDADTMHRAAYMCGVQNVNLKARVKNIYIAPIFVLLSDTRYIDHGITKYRGCSDCVINVDDVGSTHSSVPSSLFGIQLYDCFQRTKETVKFSNLKLQGTVSKSTTADIGAITTSFTSKASDILENVGLEFNTMQTRNICYARITSDDLKTVRNFRIENFVIAKPGYFTFNLGTGTEVCISKSNLYLITCNSKQGGKVSIEEEASVHEIKKVAMH